MQAEQAKGTFDVVYDDYFGTPIKKPDSPKGLYENKNPLKNTKYTELVADLVHNKNIAVSDIAFCVAIHRNNFIAAIVAAVADVEVSFVFFENNPEQSKRNVTARAREGRVEREIELIDQISKVYSKVTVHEEKTYDA